MAVVVKPTNWAAESPIYYQLGLGNDYYTVHNAGSGYTYDAKATYALTSRDNNTLRFEVRPGDNNWYDGKGGSERSEIESNEWIAHGQAFQISYKFNLEPGAANTAKWFTIGQLQEEPVEGHPGRSPEVSIELVGEKMRVVTRGHNTDASIFTKVIYQDANDIQRGHEYDIQIVGKIDPNGASRLVVMRDNVAIVDFEGSIGYTDRTMIHWKEGIYRSPSKEVVAATYSDLEINYGDMVKVPPKGSLALATAKAPTLVYGADGKLVDGAATVTVTGQAVAGQKVVIYDGTKAVTSTVAGADGKYALDVAGLGSGTHKLTATTSDASGQLSQVSNELVFEVGTGAQILGRLEYVTVKENLGAIFLTDSQTITVSSLDQMKTLVSNHQHVLDKIDGGHDFQFFSGAPNNRTHWSYDAAGVLLESDTSLYTDGVLVRKTYQYYGGDDAIVREVYQYGITGKPWVSTYQGFDQAGQMTVSTRTHADGTLDYSAVVASDGTSIVRTFDAAGKMLSQTVSQTNGAKLIENYNADGVVIFRHDLATDGKTVTSTFDPKGVVKSVVTNNPDKSSESLTYTNGVLTTKVVVHAAGDAGGIGREVFTYGVKNATYTEMQQVYSTAGKLVSTIRSHADGTLDYVNRVLNDGTTVTETYGATGVIQSRVATLVNKSTDTQTFVNGVLKTETIVDRSGTDPNKAKLVYEFGTGGQGSDVKLTIYNTYNKVVSTEYVPQTLVKTLLSQPVVVEVLTPILSFQAPVEVAQRLLATAATAASSTPALGLEDGHLNAALSGTAGAGATVKIYDGNVLIGTVKADQDGAFAFRAEGLASGQHVLTAVATDKSGNSSSPSNPVTLAIMSGDEIVSQLKTLADARGLSGIWFTGEHTLTVPAGEVAALLTKYGKVFEAISGDFQFQTVTGSGGQRMVSTFDKHGALLETRAGLTENGAPVGETVYHPSPDAPIAREVFKNGGAADGWAKSYEAFDAKGDLVLGTRSLADGTVIFRQTRDGEGTVVKENFDTKGQLTTRFTVEADGTAITEQKNASTGVSSRFVKETDGSSQSLIYINDVLKNETFLRFKDGALFQKEVKEFDQTGGSYTSSRTVSDAAGNVLTIDRFHADKTLDYSFQRKADGSTATSLYDASGNLTKTTVVNADPASSLGAKEVFNFGIKGQDHVSEHFAYDSAGRLIVSGLDRADGSRDITLKAANVKVSSTAADETFVSFRGDSFQFGKDFGNDRIQDFKIGSGSTHDKLIFEKGLFAGDDAFAAATQVGKDLVFTSLDHDTLTLVNVQKSDLQKIDILIV